MPDGNFDESNGQIAPKQGPKTGNPLVHWLSAFASLGVLAGMVFWGLQLVQRNPNEVPVIKAMDGPARALPDDPGGAELDHAGLAVNSVQSDGSAQAPAERVVLAPAPRELHADDVAVPKQVVAVKPAIAEEVEPEVATEPEVAKAETELEETGVELTELEDRTANDAPVTLKIMPVPEGAMIDTSDGVAKLVTDEDLATAEAERKAAEEAALKAAKERAAILLEEEERQRGTKYAPLVSSAPPARPTQSKAAKAFRIKREMKEAAATKKTVVNSAEQEVPEVPAGTWLVQIGAFESREVALSEWARISRRNSDLFGSKQYTIQLAESGGRKFYRLRTVGFADAKASKSFCSALKQRKLDCIAVAVR